MKQESAIRKAGCDGISRSLADCSVTEILAELGRRFNIRYGELHAKYNNYRPSTKVLIDHKVEREID